MLIESVSIEDALISGDSLGLPNLKLLLAETEGGWISQLFSLPAASEMLEDARKLADFVIIDSPELTDVVDGPPLARNVDDVLLVVRPGTTGSASSISSGSSSPERDQADGLRRRRRSAAGTESTYFFEYRSCRPVVIRANDYGVTPPESVEVLSVPVLVVVFVGSVVDVVVVELVGVVVVLVVADVVVLEVGAVVVVEVVERGGVVAAAGERDHGDDEADHDRGHEADHRLLPAAHTALIVVAVLSTTATAALAASAALAAAAAATMAAAPATAASAVARDPSLSSDLHSCGKSKREVGACCQADADYLRRRPPSPATMRSRVKSVETRSRAAAPRAAARSGSERSDPMPAASAFAVPASRHDDPRLTVDDRLRGPPGVGHDGGAIPPTSPPAPRRGMPPPKPG